MHSPLSPFTFTKNKLKNKGIIYIGNCLSVHGSTPTNIETLGPQLEAEGYKLYYASNKRNMLLRMYEMLAAIAAHRREAQLVLIDTYSTNAFYFAWASARLCKFFKLPYIPILHGGDLPQRMEHFPSMTRQLFQHSFTNVAVSAYLQEHLVRKGYKNKLIPNNIDLKAYPFKLREDIKGNLLWVRAFHKTYNPQMAIHVLAGVCEQYPEATLTMVGPEKDGSMEACKSLAEELGLRDKVNFTGRLSKAEWIKQSSDYSIFINTTDFDNLPVSVIEAMALGFPVVSTNVGGIPYLVENGKNGLLVEKRDTKAMVQAITALMAEKNRAADISRAARQKAETFDWQIIKQKWIELFNNIGK